MKRFFKVLGMGSGLILAILLICSVFLYFFFPKEKLGNWLTQTAKQSGIELTYKNIEFDWGFPSKITLTEPKFNAPNIKVSGDAQTVQMYINLWESVIHFSMRTTVIATHLNIDHPKLKLIQANITLTVSDVFQYSKSVLDIKDSKIQFKGRATQLLYQGDSILSLDQVNLKFEALLAFKSFESFSVQLKKVNSRFSSPSIMPKQTKPLPIQIALSSALATPDRMTTEGLIISIYGGSLTIPTNIHDFKTGKNESNSLRYDHPEINTLITVFSPVHKDTLGGSIHLVTNNFSQILNKSYNPILTSIFGKGKVEFKDALLKKKHLQNKLDAAIHNTNEKIKPHLSLTHQKTALLKAPNLLTLKSQGQANYLAQGGEIILNNIKLTNEESEISGQGKIYLVTKILDINLELTIYGIKQKPAEPILELIGDKNGDLVVPIHIHGSLDKPIYTVETDAIYQKAKAKILKRTLTPVGIIEQTGKGVGKGVENVFKGIKGIFK